MKYHNKPTTIDNLHFDSRAEADHYVYLKALEQSGEITDLKIHPRFMVVEGFYRMDGGKKKHERPIYYESDFSHKDVATGKTIVIDVKGVETQTWLIKKKLFLKAFPDVELRVVKA